MVLAAVGPADVALAVAPALLSFALAAAALLAARRRRRIDDAAAATNADDTHAQAALDVLLATIAAQGEIQARERASNREAADLAAAALASARSDAARAAELTATALAAARSDADHYRRRTDQEAARKHRARNRAHAWQLRAELLAILLLDAGGTPPPWTPPDPEPEPGVGETDDPHGRTNPAS